MSILVALAATSAFAAAPAFGPPNPFPSGVGSYYSALADLDGDGDLDVVTANYDGQELAVSKNNGGTFGVPDRYLVGGAGYVRIADLDADGRPDLVNIDFAGHTISIHRNLGGGAFDVRRQIPVGQFPRAIAVADVDGDGRVDILVANHETADVSILSGAAGHTAVTSTVPCGGHPKTIAAGDLDGDGRVDLVVGNYDEAKVSVLHNLPGGFSPLDLPGEAYGISELVIGDFDRDGHPDLAGACEDAQMSVWRNQGGLNFFPSRYSIGSLSQSLAIGDFDRDGALDLAAANFDQSTITVWTNDGAGHFRDPVDVACGPQPRGVAVGDLDGDGLAELVSADYSPSAPGTFSVMRNLGGGGSPGGCQRHSWAAGEGPSHVMAADLDGDESLDLAVANEDNTVSVLLQKSPGNFAPKVDVPGGLLSQALALPDYDHNGAPDLAIVVFSENLVRVLQNDGRGGFAFTGDLPVGGHPRFVVAADLDRDGMDDLVTADYGDAVHPGTVTVLMNGGKPVRREVVDHGRGRGKPRKEAPKFRASAYPVGVGPYFVGVADFDGDGRLDLYTTDYDGHTVTVLRQLPNRKFEPFGTYPVGWALAAAAGDLDRDGDIDLVVTGYQEGTIAILRNRGDGRFEPRVDLPVGVGPRSLALADVNQDDRLDIVVALAGEDEVALLAQNPDGSFEGSSCRSGRRPKWVTVADIDADGTLDFVTANYWEAAVSVIGEPGDPIARQAGPLVGAAPARTLGWVGHAKNPTGAPVTLAFALPSPMQARVDVFDISGRRVATLLDGALAAGVHQATWSGAATAGGQARAGVYFYRLAAGGQRLVRRLTLVE